MCVFMCIFEHLTCNNETYKIRDDTNMQRKCAIIYYSIIFFSLLSVQVLLLYFQFSKHTKKNTRHIMQPLQRCVDRKASQKMKRKVPDTCINKAGQKRNAFVFYITKSVPGYECYLYVLLHQLQAVYPRECNVDFVILHEAGYQFKNAIKEFKNIKLRAVKSLHYSKADWYYTNCYIKLEAFSLYHTYDRIVFFDVDGLLMKNPYPLFKLDLSPFEVGASYCNWFYPEKWLTSSIFVADLSVKLYKKISKVYSMDLNTLYPNRKRILDMEIFNWIFQEGKKLKTYSDLINMDSHYIDPDYNKFYNSSKVPYYVHFSHIKPHYNKRSSACIDRTKVKAKPEFYQIHRDFWIYYYMYC